MTDVFSEGWGVPEEISEWSDWTWFRVGPGKCLTLVSLSEQPLHYVGHYTKGRMIPCHGTECVTCRQGIGQQIRYIYAAYCPATKRTGFMEIGRSLALELQDMIPRFGKFRGMTVCYSKIGYSKNGRIQAEYVDEDHESEIIGLGCPNIKEALLLTWAKAGIPIHEKWTRSKSTHSSMPSGHVPKGSKPPKFRPGSPPIEKNA